MRTNGILVLLWATLSTVTLAGPNERSNRGPDVIKLPPIRYDGYKYGYSPVGGAGNIKSRDEEYPSRYGGVQGSLRNDKPVEEQSGRKTRYEREYDLEHLEEELTKAFLDRRRNHYNRDERLVGGVGHGSEHRSRGEYLGSSGDHGVGKEHGSGHGSGVEHHGMSGNHGSGQASVGGHLETLGGHASGGGHLEMIGGHSNAGGHTESSGGHSSGHSGISGSHGSSSGQIESGVGHQEMMHTSGGGHLKMIGGHSNAGGHTESSGGHSSEHSGISGSHGSSTGQIESGVGHQEMMHGTKTGVEHHETQNHEMLKVEGHHSSEPSRFTGQYRDRHEDHYEGRYGGRYGHHLLKDRLPYGDAHKALVGGFINAGRHKAYKGNYEEHEENYDHKGLEKGLGFFAHKDTSDEHLQLKSYYIKGDSPESYEYNPYSSYRPYGYHRRYEHSSEESKEFYGYKGLYFGSNERTGFIRDFIKSKGSEEKSKYKGSYEKSKSKSFFGKSKSKGSEEKYKSKSIGKASGLTKEYYSFVKDIMKDLEKGLSIKADDKGGKGKGEKGEEKAKGKGNNNGLFGGDLVNVIKVTFGHEEKKSEVKGVRRRRSITGYPGKFIDPSVI